jgi:hypothetical protein
MKRILLGAVLASILSGISASANAGETKVVCHNGETIILAMQTGREGEALVNLEPTTVGAHCRNDGKMVFKIEGIQDVEVSSKEAAIRFVQQAKSLIEKTKITGVNTIPLKNR